MFYCPILAGTLNPALQDRNGKPKKSVSTIIHILNDLLGASPQYRAQMIHQQRHHGRHAERMARASHRTAARASKYQSYSVLQGQISRNAILKTSKCALEMTRQETKANQPQSLLQEGLPF